MIISEIRVWRLVYNDYILSWRLASGVRHLAFGVLPLARSKTVASGVQRLASGVSPPLAPLFYSIRGIDFEVEISTFEKFLGICSGL